MGKETSNKNNLKIEITTGYQVPAKVVAAAAGCDAETVKSVRQGRRGTGKKAQRAALADELIKVGMSNLIEEVKQQIRL